MLFFLQAYAKLGALVFGEQIHNYIEEHGCDGALNLCFSLIAMYSQHGDVIPRFLRTHQILGA